jgi:hypothetical protein
MGRYAKRRPEVPDGFLKLMKRRLAALDHLPPGLGRVYIKLLTAASWAGSATGVLGFVEGPWTLRDIAAALNMDPGGPSRALKQLQRIRFNRGDTNYPLVWHGTFKSYSLPVWHLPHYAYFTGTDDDDSE